ncbi:type I methionyl aminopeptidase [Candidatus Parcubacteria bacterium]|jgi:methionyl aminopeptidase|nr:type I methionyl aminopeptidase [Candidatus Parcubacteria bacterium]
MLSRKTPKDIKILREGGKLLGSILRQLAGEVKPGVTGQELNKLAEELIKKAGGTPSFKNYRGFPCGLCVSVNQTVVHGVPNDQPFREGDLVGLDIGMKYKNLHTDTATTVAIGKLDKKVQQFLDRTKQALEIGIQEVGPDKHIGDIGKAIEKFIKPFGYGIVRDLAGHGVGYDVHEDPIVPNYNPGSKMDKMFPGMVIAIEPMIIIGGSHSVVVGKNKWDIKAQDESLTAHFEHTVAVTEDGYLIITE